MGLMELYQNKKELLLHFKTITEKMQNYLGEKRLEDFAAAVERRQQVIDQINDIDDKIKTIIDGDKAYNGTKITEGVIKDIGNILAELQSLNHKVTTLAGVNLSKLRGEMQSHHRVSKALRQYSSTPGTAHGYFLDKEK